MTTVHTVRTLILIITLALPALAGCVGVDVPDAATSGTVEDALAHLATDHDHLDPALHAHANGLTEAAYSPLDVDADRARSFGELDIVGDLAVVAVLEPVGGFVTIDVSDPANPEPLAWFEAGAAYAGDVKLSPDGKHAFLALNGLYARDEIAANPALAPTALSSSGVMVVNVKDPANPVAESFYPLQTGGVHMLDVHVIAGELYVASVQSSRVPLTPPTGNPQATSLIDIARLAELPDGTHHLEPVSTYRAPEAVKGNGFVSPHDVTIVDDAADGTLLLTAYGRAGVAVADLNDPADPKHLGTWTGHNEEYVHTVMMTEVEGKRVLVAAPEAFNGKAQNQVWFLDATDFGAMELISTWRLPGEDRPYESGYKFSTHNFNILDNKVYLAHFHAGVWVLDISTTAKLAEPEVVAQFMPARDDAVGNALGIAAIPLVWDVVPAKGMVYATDIATGFYALTPDFEMPDGVAYGTRGMT